MVKQHNFTKASIYTSLYAITSLYTLMIHYSLSAYYIVTMVTSRGIIEVNESEPNPMIMCNNPMFLVYMTSGRYNMLVMLNFIVTVFN